MVFCFFFQLEVVPTRNKSHSHYWTLSWFVETREEKAKRVLIVVFSYLMCDYKKTVKVFLEKYIKTQTGQSTRLELSLLWLNEDWSYFVGPDLRSRLDLIISPFNTKTLTLNMYLREMRKKTLLFKGYWFSSFKNWFGLCVGLGVLEQEGIIFFSLLYF